MSNKDYILLLRLHAIYFPTGDPLIRTSTLMIRELPKFFGNMINKGLLDQYPLVNEI